MADVVLKHVEKIYPYVEKKKRRFRKSAKSPKKQRRRISIDGKRRLGCQRFQYGNKRRRVHRFGRPFRLRKIDNFENDCGLEDITSGELYIDGKLCNAVEPKDREHRNGFPKLCLISAYDGFYNIAYPLKFVKSDPLPNKPDNVRHLTKEIEERVLEAAKLLISRNYLTVNQTPIGRSTSKLQSEEPSSEIRKYC